MNFACIIEFLQNYLSVGAVDVLINCAGTAIAETFEATSPEAFDQLMRLNYFGSVYVTKSLLPAMLSEGKGPSGRCIAFVSTAAALTPIYGFSAYSSSKAALTMFATILQQELEDKGLTVTTVFPPDTDTPGLQVIIRAFYSTLPKFPKIAKP